MFIKLTDRRNQPIILSYEHILRIMPTSEHVGSGVFLQSVIVQSGDVPNAMPLMVRESPRQIWRMVEQQIEEQDVEDRQFNNGQFGVGA